MNDDIDSQSKSTATAGVGDLLSVAGRGLILKFQLRFSPARGVQESWGSVLHIQYRQEPRGTLADGGKSGVVDVHIDNVQRECPALGDLTELSPDLHRAFTLLSEFGTIIGDQRLSIPDFQSRLRLNPKRRTVHVWKSVS